MEASELKLVNSILNAIGVNPLTVGRLQKYLLFLFYFNTQKTHIKFSKLKKCNLSDELPKIIFYIIHQFDIKVVIVNTLSN